jgi:hypothetical protein
MKWEKVVIENAARSIGMPKRAIRRFWLPVALIVAAL